jgi:hypothetical protein
VRGLYDSHTQSGVCRLVLLGGILCRQGHGPLAVCMLYDTVTAPFFGAVRSHPCVVVVVQHQVQHCSSGGALTNTRVC